jgi:hypothetical protein
MCDVCVTKNIYFYVAINPSTVRPCFFKTGSCLFYSRLVSCIQYNHLEKSECFCNCCASVSNWIQWENDFRYAASILDVQTLITLTVCVAGMLSDTVVSNTVRELNLSWCSLNTVVREPKLSKEGRCRMSDFGLRSFVFLCSLLTWVLYITDNLFQYISLLEL